LLLIGGRALPGPRTEQVTKTGFCGFLTVVLVFEVGVVFVLLGVVQVLVVLLVGLVHLVVQVFEVVLVLVLFGVVPVLVLVLEFGVAGIGVFKGDVDIQSFRAQEDVPADVDGIDR
jgi:hypothetical protein